MARISKNGPCVQLGNSETEKPRFVSMQKGQSIFTLTLEDALALFEHALPRTLGEWEGKEVLIGEGKYGPYVRYAGAFTSLPKTADPYTITLEEAVEVLQQQKQKDEPIHVFGDMQVLHGRYGAYIKTPQGNYRIPKTTNVQTLTEEACRALIVASEPTKRKGKR